MQRGGGFRRMGVKVGLGARDFLFGRPTLALRTHSVHRANSVSRSSVATVANTDWRADARRWIEWDPNQETRHEVASVLESGDTAALERLLGQTLKFGTAGIRGPMGAGTGSMNELTILQTSQGLCVYLEDTFGLAELQSRGVCVGYDHRQRSTLHSEGFALLAAAVFLERGVRVQLYDGTVATPLVPWAVDRAKHAAGIMITASHNPGHDNGYKVYWETGSQIVPPHDAGIARCIGENLKPWTVYNPQSVRSNPLCCDNTDILADSYFKALGQSLCYRRETNRTQTSPFAVYTAMHGVGAPWAARALSAFDLPAFITTDQQHDPDPDFPTVDFPNPEEPAGLALAQNKADQVGVDLVLANDPDADRLAVSERGSDGQWRTFTGDEIGALLAHWQWTQWRRQNPDASSSNVYMLASTVSSSILGEMARQEGFVFEETLTGFKWMGQRAADLRENGSTVLFAYEEAIGFCVGDLLKDKDGLSALACFAEMTLALTHDRAESSNSAGHTPGIIAQCLDSVIYARYGHWVSENGSVRLTVAQARCQNQHV